MDLDRFWQLIEPGKAEDEPAQSLRERLERLSPDEIESYQQWFDKLFRQAYDWRLWGAAYLIQGGCSDDGFTDFRYALISKGRDVYEAAIADADSLVNVDITGDEGFGYVALEVYSAKTAQQMPRQSVPHRKPLGEDWDFDDLDECEKRLPRITARFGQ